MITSGRKPAIQSFPELMLRKFCETKGEDFELVKAAMHGPDSCARL